MSLIFLIIFKMTYSFSTNFEDWVNSTLMENSKYFCSIVLCIKCKIMKTGLVQL